MSYRTDEKTPPPFFMCEYFERSCDPFDERIIAEALGGKKVKEKPETGWMAIDWVENAVGFTPDGTLFDCDKPDFTLEKGYFADGRMFAYQKNKYSIELKDRHKQEAEKRNLNK
jgi:hypothetical protein